MPDARPWHRSLGLGTGPLRLGLGRSGGAAVDLRAVGDAGRDHRRRLHQPRLRPDALASTSSGACSPACRPTPRRRRLNVIVTSRGRRSSSAARWPRCGSSRSSTAAALARRAAARSAARWMVGRSLRLDRPGASSCSTRCWPRALGLETIGRGHPDRLAARPRGGRRLATYGWLCGFGAPAADRPGPRDGRRLAAPSGAAAAGAAGQGLGDDVASSASSRCRGSCSAGSTSAARSPTRSR